MGQTRIYPPVKLFAAITISDTALWSSILERFEKLYSGVDQQIDWYPFTHTNYYQEEMGENLSKRLIAFSELTFAEKLVDIKLASNNLEAEFSQDGKRRVNIDPGYLTASKIVLATTKDYSHRLYLGRGIFGDVHLWYRNHNYQATDWTYPDYKEPFVLAFFEEVRDKYMKQLAEYEF